MKRLLPVAIAALLLAACSGAGNVTTSPDESNATATTCSEAFASLSQDQLNDLQNLDQASATLDETLSACDSVDQWVAQAILAVPDLSDADALAFLEGRCRANPELAHLNACADASGSMEPASSMEASESAEPSSS